MALLRRNKQNNVQHRERSRMIAMGQPSGARRYFSSIQSVSEKAPHVQWGKFTRPVWKAVKAFFKQWSQI
jgi:hypothetical protein